MAWFPEAQAVVMVIVGPFRPYFMEIWPGAIFDIIMGIKSGLTFWVPFQ